MMSTPQERREIYQTKRWRLLRLEVQKQAGCLCESCAREGRTRLGSVVHHVRPIRSGGDPWDRNNLELVCKECHKDIHDQLDAEHEPVPGQRAWLLNLRELVPNNP